MVARIVIAGETQCEGFAQVCLVADHLSKHLPNFCYERIVKPVSEWEPWLLKVNQRNYWHHIGSPLIWKELLLKGSKPYYIGGAPEFWEYCHAYYKFDTFMSEKIFVDLENGIQYQKKLKAMKGQVEFYDGEDEEDSSHYVICIAGASHKSTPHIISGLMDLSQKSTDKKISKIYLFDNPDFTDQLESLETDCSYIGSYFPNRVVRAIDRLGIALTECDLLIVLNHCPFNPNDEMEEWLLSNIEEMLSLADSINASASSEIRVIFPNFGPACFNATFLSHATVNISRNNIVVSTSDLGLEALLPASEIAEIPLKNIHCPPVWGFTGINHLADLRTTLHRYCAFEPYRRFVRVKDTTLRIGTLRPELRPLQYLMHWDKSLWLRVADRKKNMLNGDLNKIVSLLDTINLWLFGCSPDDIVNLGIACDGSFGLTLNGVFSQPAHCIEGYWKPAAGLFPTPKDPFVNITYLEKIAQKIIDDTNIPKHVLRCYASSSILLRKTHSNRSLKFSKISSDNSTLKLSF